MGAPTIIVKQFDALARFDEIEAILEIGNGEWSRGIEFRGYNYTVIVSDRLTNSRIEARKGGKTDTLNQHTIVKYWMVGVTPQTWGKTADDPLGFGRISEDNSHVVYYSLGVTACPCVVIGWVEGFAFANRTHIKIKTRGYQEDSAYSLLCALGDILIDELTSYGVECLASHQDGLAVKDKERHFEQHIGTQTNIYGPINGPVASGEFQSATTFGGGEATDQRGRSPDDE